MTDTTPAENKALVRRVPLEIVNERSVDLADDLFAEEFVDHNPLLGDVEGREAYKQAIHDILSAFPDLTVTPEDMLAEDDRVATRLVLEGTHEGEYLGVTATGNEARYHANAFFRIEEGLIVERWVLADLHSLLVQLDVSPSIAELRDG